MLACSDAGGEQADPDRRGAMQGFSPRRSLSRVGPCQNHHPRGSDDVRGPERASPRARHAWKCHGVDRALGFGLWITGGLILVLWALEHGQTDDAFASIYHLPIYLGLAAVCLYCGGRGARRTARRWLAAGAPGRLWIVWAGRPRPQLAWWSNSDGARASASDRALARRWPPLERSGPGDRTDRDHPTACSARPRSGRVPRPAMLISAALVIGIAGTWGPFHPAFSPWLEQADLTPYTSGELWIMDGDGSHQTRLVEEKDPTISLSYASWSPDGRLISYTRFHTPGPRRDAGGCRRLDGGGRWDERPPDRRWHWHAVDPQDRPGRDLRRIHPGGGRWSVGQRRSGRPRWRSRARWRSARRSALGPLANADLWQASADGAGEPLRLSDSAADDRAPVYSPAGRVAGSLLIRLATAIPSSTCLTSRPPSRRA